MGSEYPNIKLNNKLVEIDEEEQESLRDSINKRANENDIELESANIKEEIIHILLKSLLSDDDTQDLVQDLTEVKVQSHLTGKQIKKHVYSLFNIKREYVLKLRNENNSVVPFSSTITGNSPEEPYTLEVCYPYCTVTPLPRTVSNATYEQLLKRKMNSTNNRMVKLEDFMPDLPKKQETKINEEIKDLNDKMNILERKLNDADSTNWQGMFDRVPLW